MEEMICIIVCKGAYVDIPGSDYLFQKKRVFRISESAVFRYGQQKEVALKALVNLVPFETHVHIGVVGEEMAELLKEIKYFKGAELSIKKWLISKLRLNWALLSTRPKRLKKSLWIQTTSSSL